jgi:hypothetical protein
VSICDGEKDKDLFKFFIDNPEVGEGDAARKNI